MRVRVGGVAGMVAQHRCVGNARTEAVDANPLAAIVQRQRLGQHQHRAFAGAVGGRALLRHEAGNGCHVEDRTAAGRAQVRQRVLGRQEDRAHVDRHHPVPILHAARLHRLHGDDAGVVDDDIQPAKVGDRGGDQGAHVGFLRHIGVDIQALGAAGGDGCCRRRANFVIEVGHRHRCACTCQRPRDALPDALRPTGDNRYLARKICHRRLHFVAERSNLLISQSHNLLCF